MFLIAFTTKSPLLVLETAVIPDRIDSQYNNRGRLRIIKIEFSHEFIEVALFNNKALRDLVSDLILRIVEESELEFNLPKTRLPLNNPGREQTDLSED